MTIRPGGEWGRPCVLPTDAPEVASDAALAALAGAARAEGRDPPTVALSGGDLHRTLGGIEGRPRWATGTAACFEVDLVEVRLDGRPHWAVAHVIAQGRRGWAGETWVAMNAAFLGPLELGPRAHPGDGLLDVTEGRLRWGERREGRRRMAAGGHLPHPGLRTSRVASVSVVLSRGTSVRLDGVAAGRARSIEVVVHPDSATVVV